MYISEIIIEQFGAQVNKRIPLSPDFNLITGANESGKSTLCAFIKYVLYGFEDSKERVRHSSLDTGAASGALIVVQGEKSYRIQRKNPKSVTVYDEENGCEFNDWKTEAQTPGEYFLKIPASLYTRAAYVSQSQGSRLDDDTANAISNLLLTGDEAINLKRAKKLLEEARKALKLKKGVGGKICDLEAQINEAKIKLSAAIEAKNQAQSLYAALYDTKHEIEELKTRIEAANGANELSKLQKIRAHLDRRSEMQDSHQKKQLLLLALIEDNTYNGFFPDAEYESSLRSLQSEIDVYSQELQKAEEKLRSINSSNDKPTEYDVYCLLGKKDKILAGYLGLSSRIKKSGVFTLISVFASVISLILFTSALILDSFKGLTPVFAALLGISALGVISGLALKHRFSSALLQITVPLNVSQDRTVAFICDICNNYEFSNESNNTRFLNDSIEENKSTLAKKTSELGVLLAKWNKADCQRALTDYAELTQKRLKLQLECSEIKTRISVTDAHLSIYTDSEILSASKLDSEAVSKSVENPQNVDNLKALLNAATEKKSGLEIQLAGLSSPHTEIEALNNEIDKKTAILDDYRQKYDAITLTISALEEAENIIRSTVSPYLSAEASVYFKKITEGRYQNLRVDSEMDLTYVKSDSQTVTAEEYLSIGSADLAWLCLRLALHKKLSSDGAIPLILDEALVYFDDNRLALIINELTEIAEADTQILLFSASTRELAMLGGAGNIITL